MTIASILIQKFGKEKFIKWSKHISTAIYLCAHCCVIFGMYLFGVTVQGGSETNHNIDYANSCIESSMVATLELQRYADPANSISPTFQHDRIVSLINSPVNVKLKNESGKTLLPRASDVNLLDNIKKGEDAVLSGDTTISRHDAVTWLSRLQMEASTGLYTAVQKNNMLYLVAYIYTVLSFFVGFSLLALNISFAGWWKNSIRNDGQASPMVEALI